MFATFLINRKNKHGKNFQLIEAFDFEIGKYTDGDYLGLPYFSFWWKYEAGSVVMRYRSRIEYLEDMGTQPSVSSLQEAVQHMCLNNQGWEYIKEVQS